MARVAAANRELLYDLVRQSILLKQGASQQNYFKHFLTNEKRILIS